MQLPTFVKGSVARSMMMLIGVLLLLLGVILVAEFGVFGGGAVAGFGFVMSYLSVRA